MGRAGLAAGLAQHAALEVGRQHEAPRGGGPSSQSRLAALASGGRSSSGLRRKKPAGASAGWGGAQAGRGAGTRRRGRAAPQIDLRSPVLDGWHGRHAAPSRLSSAGSQAGQYSPCWALTPGLEVEAQVLHGHDGPVLGAHLRGGWHATHVCSIRGCTEKAKEAVKRRALDACRRAARVCLGVPGARTTCVSPTLNHSTQSALSRFLRGAGGGGPLGYVCLNGVPAGSPAQMSQRAQASRDRRATRPNSCAHLSARVQSAMPGFSSGLG